MAIMTKNGTAFEIDETLDMLSYQWILEQYPTLLRALERDVAQGRTAVQIRERVIERTGRPDLAARCEQAARHVVRGGVE